jgi:hypothetical protein
MPEKLIQAISGIVALGLLSAPVVTAEAAGISDVVAGVSVVNYTQEQLAIENMGLGLYDPNHASANRDRNGWAGIGSAGNQEARSYLQDRFGDLGLEVSTQGVYRNVIGEMVGIGNAEDILIVCGHYDHVAGDRPGGDDNASGTAGVLEAARVLSGYTFASTIRFIGFNAEEDGLLGSKHYVNNQVLPEEENIVGVVNLDMILRPGWDSNPSAVIDLDLGTRTSKPGSVNWANLFQAAAATYVPSLTVDSSVFNITGGSDHDPFAAAGFPAFLAIENSAQDIWYGGSNAYYHTNEDASDRLANDPNSPSGIVYDYEFATDTVRATVALISEQAELLALLGDLDGDADNDIDDLQPMLLAIADRNAYESAWPQASAAAGDINRDGALTIDDLQPFLVRLTSSEAIPEPGLLAVMLVPAVAFLPRYRNRPLLD